MLTKKKESAILYLESFQHSILLSANKIELGGIIMKLEPLADRVVLKQLVAEETTKSGIVLPGQSKENHSRQKLLLQDLAELLMEKKLR